MIKFVGIVFNQCLSLVLMLLNLECILMNNFINGSMIQWLTTSGTWLTQCSLYRFNAGLELLYLLIQRIKLSSMLGNNFLIVSNMTLTHKNITLYILDVRRYIIQLLLGLIKLFKHHLLEFNCFFQITDVSQQTIQLILRCSQLLIEILYLFSQ